MPTRRGTSNRRTGKTTPRTKGTTHWGAKSRARHSAKAAASAPSSSSKK